MSRFILLLLMAMPAAASEQQDIARATREFNKSVTAPASCLNERAYRIEVLKAFRSGYLAARKDKK